MIFVQKIRKMLNDILEYYGDKENKSNNIEYYYIFESPHYMSEFQCLSNEKRIGLQSKLKKSNVYVCIKILEMLYERNYDFLLDLYKNQNLYDVVINDFCESLDDPNLWKNLIKKYYKTNQIKLSKYDAIPVPHRNYKTKPKYYEISQIQEEYFK